MISLLKEEFEIKDKEKLLSILSSNSRKGIDFMVDGLLFSTYKEAIAKLSKIIIDHNLNNDQNKLANHLSSEELKIILELNDKYSLPYISDINIFVKPEIKVFLESSGWELKTNLCKHEFNNKLYPMKLSGMQVWFRSDNNEMQLDIYYEDNGKHSVTLWWDGIHSESFKIRNIRSVLKKRGLI